MRMVTSCENDVMALAITSSGEFEALPNFVRLQTEVPDQGWDRSA